MLMSFTWLPNDLLKDDPPSKSQLSIIACSVQSTKTLENPRNLGIIRTCADKSHLCWREGRGISCLTFPFVQFLLSLQLSRNNSIRKACYTGYSHRKTYALELESNHHRNPGDALRSTGHSC